MVDAVVGMWMWNKCQVEHEDWSVVTFCDRKDRTRSKTCGGGFFCGTRPRIDSRIETSLSVIDYSTPSRLQSDFCGRSVADKEPCRCLEDHRISRQGPVWFECCPQCK